MHCDVYHTIRKQTDWRIGLLNVTYNRYSKSKGFSVKVDRALKRRVTIIILKYWVCRIRAVSRWPTAMVTTIYCLACCVCTAFVRRQSELKQFSVWSTARRSAVRSKAPARCPLIAPSCRCWRRRCMGALALAVGCISRTCMMATWRRHIFGDSLIRYSLC